MNPRSFPNTRSALSDEEPEIVDMSLDSPASPEEAGANGRSPSPTPDYDPGEEADILLDQAEAVEVRTESPDYVAPGLRSPSPSALSTLFHQVRGAGPSNPATPDNLERGMRSREEEGRRRARARLLLDQDRRAPESAGGGPSFNNPRSTGRSTGAESEDWVCICRLCKLYPGRPCGTNWPRRPVAKGKGANREEESDEAEKRRCRSVST